MLNGILKNDCIHTFLYIYISKLQYIYKKKKNFVTKKTLYFSFIEPLVKLGYIYVCICIRILITISNLKKWDYFKLERKNNLDPLNLWICIDYKYKLSIELNIQFNEIISLNVSFNLVVIDHMHSLIVWSQIFDLYT